MAVNKPNEFYWEEKTELSEKAWISLAVVACVLMFAVMVGWAIFGKQNPPNEAYKILPSQFEMKTKAFIEKYKIGEEDGVPVVKAPENEDSYLLARTFRWEPILVLKKDRTYRIRMSSVDLQHGLSIQPVNINFQAVPGYEYVLTIRPTQSGEFTIICNEFCGLGHHIMRGKIIVEE